MADDIKYDVELDLKSFKKSKKELDNSFKKTQKNAKDMSGNMTKGFNASSIAMAGMAGGAIALSTAIAGGVTMTKKLVEESGALEDSKITWEQLTGSVIEAEKRIKSLRNFSDRTPFTFKGVDSASQSLYNLSNGILSTEADLQLLGDASAKGRQKIDEMAVTWGRLYQKLSSGDKAFGDEINRMAELGIITGETKKEIQAMSSEMLKKEGWKTFEEGAKSASGFMDKLADSINGKLSTIQGKWDGLFALEGNALDSTKDSLDDIIKLLDDNKDTVQDFFSFSLEAFNSGIKIAMSGLETYMDYVKWMRAGSKQDIAGQKLVDLQSASDKKTKSELVSTRTGNLRDSAINQQSLAVNSKILGKELTRDIAVAVTTGNEAMIDSIKWGNTNLTDSIDEQIKLLEKQNEISTSNMVTSISLQKINNAEREADKKTLEDTTKDKVADSKSVVIDYSKISIDYSKIPINTNKDTNQMDLYNSQLNEYEEVFKKFLQNDYQNIIKDSLNMNYDIVGDDKAKFYDELISLAPKLSKKAMDIDSSSAFDLDMYKKSNKSLGIDENTYRGGINEKIYEEYFKLESALKNQDKLEKDLKIKLKSFKTPTEIYYKILRQTLLDESSNAVWNEKIKQETDKYETKSSNLENNLKKGTITKEEFNKQSKINFDETTKIVNDLSENLKVDYGKELTKIQSEYNIISAENQLTILETVDKNMKELSEKIQFDEMLTGITSMVSSTDSAFKSMDTTIKQWSYDTNTTFSEGMSRTFSIMSNLTNGTSGVLGGLEQSGLVSGLGSLIPGLGLATAGFGLVSNLFDIFGSKGDDPEDITSQQIARNNENKPDIVSTAVDTIIVNANMSVYTTYVDEAGFDQLFTDEIAPRFAEYVQGVYR